MYLEDLDFSDDEALVYLKAKKCMEDRCESALEDEQVIARLAETYLDMRYGDFKEKDEVEA